jgi:AcrR family transcriptional regulator
MPQKLGLTKKDVRQAAVEVFGRRGYGGSSTSEVAAVLGITKASLFHHYSTKHALMAAVVEPYLVDLTGVLDDVDLSAEGGSAVLLRRFVACLLAHRDIVRFVYRDISVLEDPDVGGRVDELSRRLLVTLMGDLPEPALSSITGAVGSMALAFSEIEPFFPELGELLIQTAVAAAAVLRARYPTPSLPLDRHERRRAERRRTR